MSRDRCCQLLYGKIFSCANVSLGRLCSIVGNIAVLNATSVLDLSPARQRAAIQICVWDALAEQPALPCTNLSFQGNVAAGSPDYGFLLQASLSHPSKYLPC